MIGRCSRRVFESQGAPNRRITANNRSMRRDRHREVNRFAASHADPFVPDIGLFPLATISIPGRIVYIKTLDIQILVVGVSVSDTPGNMVIVAKMREARNAGKGEANDIECRTGNMVLVVGIRGL